MTLWNQIVEILRESIFAYAQVSNGNLAVGILAVAFLARLALFPLTLWLARVTSAHQDRVRQIQPELNKAHVRFKNDPSRLAEEIRRIYAREGIPVMPVASLIGGVVQAPVLLALYSAVRQCAAIGGRFLWIADISRPDKFIVALVTALTAMSMALVPQSGAQHRTFVAILPAVLTMIVLSKMAAGVGLYWGVSSAAGVVQAAVARRNRSA